MKRTIKKTCSSNEEGYKPRQPPKGVRPCCRNCKYGELHVWVNSNISDPMIAICTLGARGERNVARTGYCKQHDYYPEYEGKVIARHEKVHNSTANIL